MSKDEFDLIKAATQACEVDVPVMSWRQVGSRLELYLYGGGVAYFDTVTGKKLEPIFLAAAPEAAPAASKNGPTRKGKKR